MGKRSTPTRLKRMSQADSSVPPEAVPSSPETEPKAVAGQEFQSAVSSDLETANPESSSSVDSALEQESPQETAVRAELEVEAAKELFAKIGETVTDAQDAASAYSALLAYHMGQSTAAQSQVSALDNETTASVDNEETDEPPVQRNEKLTSIQSDTNQEGSEP